MALPTPIEMPSPLPVKAKSFDLNYAQLISPSGTGFSQTIERGPTLWSASYETPPLNDLRDQKMQAFLDELEGSMGTFLAYDPRRPRPYFYRGTIGKPWVQTGQADAIVIAGNYTASTLKLGRLQNGAVFTNGDYISFKIGRAWYIHRVGGNGGVVVGNEVTLKVKSRPITFTGATHVARLDKACCTMKLNGKPEKQDTVDSFPQYRFSAFQFVDRSTDP